MFFRLVNRKKSARRWNHEHCMAWLRPVDDARAHFAVQLPGSGGRKFRASSAQSGPFYFSAAPWLLLAPLPKYPILTKRRRSQRPLHHRRRFHMKPSKERALSSSKTFTSQASTANLQSNKPNIPASIGSYPGSNRSIKISL